MSDKAFEAVSQSGEEAPPAALMGSPSEVSQSGDEAPHAALMGSPSEVSKSGDEAPPAALMGLPSGIKVNGAANGNPAGEGKGDLSTGQKSLPKRARAHC